MKTKPLSSILAAALTLSANAAPKMLPFQGHLTQSNGDAVDDGTKVVQFKIYDAPVSGNAVWAGEVHKLSVNKGLVNTILGTKTASTKVPSTPRTTNRASASPSPSAAVLPGPWAATYASEKSPGTERVSCWNFRAVGLKDLLS